MLVFWVVTMWGLLGRYCFLDEMRCGLVSRDGLLSWSLCGLTGSYILLDITRLELVRKYGLLDVGPFELVGRYGLLGCSAVQNKALKIKAVRSSETLVSVYTSTRFYNREDPHRQSSCCSHFNNSMVTLVFFSSFIKHRSKQMETHNHATETLKLRQRNHFNNH
jgi:hypothetical protein